MELINKIVKLFDIAGKDGMMHLIISALISTFFSLILPWWIVAIIVLVIGIAKEWYDKQGNGTCEWKDIICDIIGIVIGIL